MFQPRPPFPWLYVAPEDEEQQFLGFNVQPPLLDNFVRAARGYAPASTGSALSFPTDPFGLQAPEAPRFGMARWPAWLGSEDSDPPQPEYRPEWPAEEDDEEQSVEIQVPPGASGGKIDTLPQSRPSLPPPWTLQPWPEPTTGPDNEEGDFEQVPIPAPWPVPAPPVPTPPQPLPRPDPVAEATRQLARLYGLRGTGWPLSWRQPLQMPSQSSQSSQSNYEFRRLQGDIRQARVHTDGVDSRFVLSNAGWRFPKGPKGPSRPKPPAEDWKLPPRDHNNPPGPSPTELPPQPFDLKKLLDLILRLGPLIRGQDYDPFSDMEVPPGGVMTRAGVRMHPDLPEPAEGRDYLPRRADHQRGYIGELHLANRVANEAPGEIVIRYGNRAGAHGPDIITVNRQGRVFVLDSKWRTNPRGITEGARAHPNLNVREMQNLLLDALLEAYTRKQISGILYGRAVTEVRAGNFSIGTIGTGNAYDGVVQDIVDGVVGPPRRITGPSEKGGIARIFEGQKP